MSLNGRFFQASGCSETRSSGFERRLHLFLKVDSFSMSRESALTSSRTPLPPSYPSLAHQLPPIAYRG
jgi:hypothetical protein